uniref:TAFA chemokine like family member 5, like n=1 Tax=Astyanax mexicanus TaxID=7994 RepID=A0A3B1J3P9_ASTMX
MTPLLSLWLLEVSNCSCIFVCVCVCVCSLTGQLAVGTCEIVMLNRDSSQPKRTIARQTARCACRRGQIAGTTRARPACVDARIVKSRQWCEMTPCSEGEICGLLFNHSGWTCTKGGGRIKTVTVRYLLSASIINPAITVFTLCILNFLCVKFGSDSFLGKPWSGFLLSGPGLL